MTSRMWGGRFAEGPDAIMEEINASIGFDKKLFRQDIAASKAHARMLAAQGIIAADLGDKIDAGLDTILREIEAGEVHLHARARGHPHPCRGAAHRTDRDQAGRLHTARSRNDQVATDFRLFVRDAIDEIDAGSATSSWRSPRRRWSMPGP